MRTGKLRRFIAVCMTLAMVFGLMPGMTIQAKAYVYDKKAGTGVIYPFFAIDFIEPEMLARTDWISVGFTRPTATVGGDTIYGDVGFTPGSFADYGFCTGEYLYDYRDYYFIANTAGIYTFSEFLSFDETEEPDKYYTITIEVSPGCTTPTVTTNDATSFSSSGATLNGTINPNNGSTSVIFYYGLNTSYGAEVTAEQSPISGSAETAVSKAVTGLKPNTLYHYKVSATNLAGAADGGDKTFTTSKAAPAATTNAASPITSTGATLNGTVNASNESTAVTFEYGTSTGYGSTVTAAQSPVTGTIDTSVSYALTGLNPNTTYHYRIVAENSQGPTNGADQTFTTSAVVPTVTTGSAIAESITSSTATITGKVNANNASTTVTFEYGLTASYGLTVTASQSPATGMGETTFSKEITGLNPNTTYHFRVVGVNTEGTSNGSDATFTTGKAAPIASTNDASPIAPTGATLHGTVNAMNDSTTVTFQYGKTETYGSDMAAAESPLSGVVGTPVSCAITGLEPNTTYHFRVAASNSTNTTYSSDATFTTPLKPAVFLTADTADNDVDHPLEITFTADTAFEVGITAITYGGTTLTASTDYTVSSGKITLNPAGNNAALQKSGTANLVISATGYYDSTVSQTITAGAAAAMEVTTQPVPGLNSGNVFATQPQVTLKDQYGNICADGPSSSATVIAVPATGISGSGSWVIGGTDTVSAVNGVITFTDLTCDLTAPGSGAISFLPGLAIAGVPEAQSDVFTIPLRAAVTLTADTADNDVDHPLEITFTADTAFEGGITAITYGGTLLTALTDYAVSSGKITLIPAGNNAALQKPGTANLVISAAGYNDSSVPQTITAGAAAAMEVTTQPVPGTNSGDVFATQPVVTLKDQYGNICSDGPSSSATVIAAPKAGIPGSGSWVIGGTDTQSAINGVITFIDLTCDLTAPGESAMVFLPGPDISGITGAESNTFTIPLRAAVTLTADTSDNSVDNELVLDFGSVPQFAESVTSITFNGTALTEGTDYEVYKDSIALKPAGGNPVLRTPATAILTVAAAGFRDSSVSQTITAGAAAAMEVTTQPVPGVNSGDVFATQPQVTLKDQYGNICADGPSSSATVIAAPKAGIPGSGSWVIGGTDTQSAINGVITFIDLTCDLTAPGESAMVFLPGLDISGIPQAESNTFTIPLRAAVTLTADTADNDVDHALDITFTPDVAFETGITSVTYGGTLLTASADYTVSSGKITLIPAGNNAVLQKSGTANLVISATGYNESTISQPITAGAAAVMEVTTQPVPGVNSGDVFATQPQVTLKDQYGNICADGPSSSATVIAAPKPGIPGSGSWGIGGTDTVSAVNGIISFSDLTCDLTAPGESAMVFLPGPDISGIPVAESNTFTIPLKQAVTFTADTSDNSVDYEINIDYGPASGFASAIISITFGGASLAEGTDYEVYKDSIALKPAGGNPALRKPGTALLVVKAAGFRDSSVTQTITAGEVASLTVSTEPQPGQNSGDAFLTQPVVILKDQYGNTCADGPSVAADVTASAAKGTGTWDIGGTVTRAAVNGIATFDGLTCTQVSYGTGVMNFASGLVTGSSAAFDLPLKAAVILTADSSDNSVDHEISIDYGSASGFANVISSITFGGASLAEGTDYEVYKDSIALKPAGGNPALRKPATALLVVKAAGFRDSSVTQTITAGEVAVLSVGTEPKPGVSSGGVFAVQPIVILKDQYGNICSDGPSASAEVTASALAGTGKWVIGGTVLKTAVNGTAAFTGLTATQLDPGTGAVRFTAGAASGTSLAFDLPLKSPVILYPAVSGNSVDNAIEIVFPANADFEKKITGVSFGGTLLVQGTDYTVTSGKITLKPAGGNAVLRKPGTANVTVSAAGYKDCTASQTITAGAVASIAVTTQPVPGKVSGDTFATQPKVTLYDRYGNVCIDGPSSSALVTVSAAADTGTWAIGGAASRLAVNGVAAFSGLTSANVTPGKGKMNFACEAFTVSSASFAIPERNASISASSARFDKYAESGNNKNITVTLALNGNTLDAIRNGTAMLVPNTDYTVNADTAVIKKEYLAKQPKGTIKLTFDFSQGTDPVLSITVSDATPASSSDGTPAVNVIVNGEGQDAGSVSTTEKDGKTETTVTVDNGKLQQILDSKGNNASVVIPVTTGSSVSSVVMNGQMMSALQSSQATLKVQTETSTYTLPSDGLDMDEVAKELGEDVPKSKVQVNITISEPPAETVQVVEDAAEEGNFAIVVPAVEFKVECSYKEQTVEVKNFNAYVERTIAIPDGVDPYKITTAVVVRPDKTTYHVPTKITVIDGKYYAVINSLTNSTYTVIWHPVAYEDMKDHWAKEAVNDMGSRMVVTGVDDKNYAPDEQITRADFVADVVRALGLNPGEGENPYADVMETDWYYGYVKTAAAYGLLETDGTSPFAAMETVSREEAMAMIDKAMKIAKMEITLKDEEVKALLQAYGDGASVSEADKQSVAACLMADVTFDLKEGLQPKTPVTRAEAAVILRLLLQKAELI